MPILALVTEYCELPDEQVVVLFQILAAEINFGYKFQTVKCALSPCLLVLCMHSQELQLPPLLSRRRSFVCTAVQLFCCVRLDYDEQSLLCRCEKFNGQELHNLKQLAEAVDNCKWVLFLFLSALLVVFPQQHCATSLHSSAAYALFTLHYTTDLSRPRAQMLIVTQPQGGIIHSAVGKACPVRLVACPEVIHLCLFAVGTLAYW